MKLFTWNVAVLAAMVVMGGCAMGKPLITELSGGRYQIKVEGGLRSKDVVAEEWKKAATEKCGKYEIISFNQQFIDGPGGQTAEGIIECKK